MNDHRKFRPRRAFAFLFIIPFILLMSLVVMLLWNNILQAVIAVKAITYWQALGILVLSKILFGGFGHRWGGGRRFGMHQKLQNMTPEEREQFKASWRNRCNQWRQNRGEANVPQEQDKQA
ncbi:MAG: hypothetical protein H0W12_06295 [Chitinophagaceae bacterium]|nr:hypothetical protein [Chitinophagaceae bacterium]